MDNRQIVPPLNTADFPIDEDTDIEIKDTAMNVAKSGLIFVLFVVAVESLCKLALELI